MPTHLKTTISAVGPDVADLAEGGVLILFADGAPPELAEVSVLHKVVEGPSDRAPGPGAEILVGDVGAVMTAIGPVAWKKVHDIGHVVINFNDAKEAERPGEICASTVDGERFLAALKPGSQIVIRT